MTHEDRPTCESYHPRDALLERRAIVGEVRESRSARPQEPTGRQVARQDTVVEDHRHRTGGVTGVWTV